MELHLLHLRLFTPELCRRVPLLPARAWNAAPVPLGTENLSPLLLDWPVEFTQPLVADVDRETLTEHSLRFREDGHRMNPDLRPGGEFHTMPSSRLHNPVNARLKMADSAVLREKTIFSPRNASVSEWTLSRILKIKISRDTKQLFRKPSLPRMRRLLSLLFSTILFFLLSFFSRYLFLFLLTISRPPRGYVRTKKVLHTLSISRLGKSSGISPDPESLVAILHVSHFPLRNQRFLHCPTGPL